VRSDRPAEKRWFATTAPGGVRRYDDIHFLSEAIGWAINNTGQILRTVDGGEHWQEQANFERWLRCISMVDERIGWVGGKPHDASLEIEDILFKTTDGLSWNPVTNLPMEYRSPDDADSPSAICGLYALPDGKHVFAAGTNERYKPTRFLRSSDGGESWTCRDMGKYAALLVDVYFENEREGWLAGGRRDPRTPGDENVVAAIWHTVDGGATWREVLGDQVDRPPGEEWWGWKIQFVDHDFIAVSTQSHSSASILITEDHGRRWCRREVPCQGNLQGIGFLDRRRGWVGGWGPGWDGRTSVTEDGGNHWCDATSDFETPESGARPPQLTRSVSGQDINRFRVIRGDDPVIYAAGKTVYKYTDAPVRAPSLGAGHPPPLVLPQDLLRVADGPVSFTVELPAGARRLVIHIYDRFADRKRTIMEDDPRPPGPHPVVWDIADDDGRPLPPGAYFLQVSCDDRCASLTILVRAHHERGGTGSDEPER
jgi:photosystem II stability/assembly factor-like uncharacterized protein